MGSSTSTAPLIVYTVSMLPNLGLFFNQTNKFGPDAVLWLNIGQSSSLYLPQNRLAVRKLAMNALMLELGGHKLIISHQYKVTTEILKSLFEFLLWNPQRQCSIHDSGLT